MGAATKTRATKTKPFALTLTGVDAAEFCNNVRTVAIAASTDDARIVLTYIRLRCDGKGTMRLTATDSYRLYEVTRPAPGLPAVDALLPRRLVNHLPRRLREPSAMTLTVADGRVTVDVNGETWSAPLGPTSFPNSDQLLADHASPVVDETVDRAFNPTYLGDVFCAARMFGADYSAALRVTSMPTDAMKPCRFEVRRFGGATLTMLLMPVRIL